MQPMTEVALFTSFLPTQITQKLKLASLAKHDSKFITAFASCLQGWLFRFIYMLHNFPAKLCFYIHLFIHCSVIACVVSILLCHSL